MRYDFEWDPAKAATVFHDPMMLALFDGRHSDAEDRWVTMGVSGSGRLLVVIRTFSQMLAESAPGCCVADRELITELPGAILHLQSGMVWDEREVTK
ncbi:MAG: BrnT family toxin [Deltaproteobacteria bacterium]|nr:BrnT family toxin [Deltaproteobacteria bacterium]